MFNFWGPWVSTLRKEEIKQESPDIVEQSRNSDHSSTPPDSNETTISDEKYIVLYKQLTYLNPSVPEHLACLNIGQLQHVLNYNKIKYTKSETKTKIAELIVAKYRSGMLKAPSERKENSNSSSTIGNPPRETQISPTRKPTSSKAPIDYVEIVPDDEFFVEDPTFGAGFDLGPMGPNRHHESSIMLLPAALPTPNASIPSPEYFQKGPCVAPLPASETKATLSNKKNTKPKNRKSTQKDSENIKEDKKKSSDGESTTDDDTTKSRPVTERRKPKRKKPDDPQIETHTKKQKSTNQDSQQTEDKKKKRKKSAATKHIPNTESPKKETSCKETPNKERSREEKPNNKASKHTSNKQESKKKQTPTQNTSERKSKTQTSDKNVRREHSPKPPKKNESANKREVLKKKSCKKESPPFNKKAKENEGSLGTGAAQVAKFAQTTLNADGNRKAAQPIRPTRTERYTARVNRQAAQSPQAKEEAKEPEQPALSPQLAPSNYSADITQATQPDLTPHTTPLPNAAELVENSKSDNLQQKGGPLPEPTNCKDETKKGESTLPSWLKRRKSSKKEE